MYVVDSSYFIDFNCQMLCMCWCVCLFVLHLECNKYGVVFNVQSVRIYYLCVKLCMRHCSAHHSLLHFTLHAHIHIHKLYIMRINGSYGSYENVTAAMAKRNTYILTMMIYFYISDK